jgi:plasmid stabilization system protein ParE
MIRRIIVQPFAEVEIEEGFQWLSDQSPDRAATWVAGLRKAIDSLRTFPRRCPVAPESAEFGEEVRVLLYGKRRSRNAYRVLFSIRGDTIHVLGLRHAARGGP